MNKGRWYSDGTPPEAVEVASDIWDASLKAAGAAGPKWDGAGIMQMAYLEYAKAAIISLAEQGLITKRGLRLLGVTLEWPPRAQGEAPTTGTVSSRRAG